MADRAAGPAEVAAVVVNYNAGGHLMECVRSLRAEGVDEIVVVDNGSVDGSAGALARSEPDAVVLSQHRNLGYGAGANVGIRHSTAPLVLVCNPDLTFEPGAVKALVAALDAHERRAVVGPRVVDPDGSLYPSARTFPALGDALGHALLGLIAPQNRWSRRYKLLDWDHSQPAEVDWVSGACFLGRRTALAELGGFDESYFMYSEDVDLCWRAWKRGWRVAYEPAATVVHVQGVSTDRRPYRMIAEHHRSLFRFAWRTTEGRRRLLLPLVGLGLAVRAALAAAQRLAEGPLARRRAHLPASGRGGPLD